MIENYPRMQLRGNGGRWIDEFMVGIDGSIALGNTSGKSSGMLHLMF
jgi:hypothetical protein